MTFWAYMLRCADGTYYMGQTSDVEARTWQHQQGLVRGYTYSRRPVELVWCQAFEERAMAAELTLKGWGRRKKEAFLAGDEKRFKFFSRKPSERKHLAERQRGAPPSVSEVDAAPILADARTSTSLALGEERKLTPPPAIVLVRPQLAENIGKAARAMLNFGLTDLRLVAPRDGWPNPDAGPAAAGADVVIGNARVFETVADAVADCAHVYATTVRKRGVVKPVVDAAEAAATIHAGPGRSAVLFGPERAGLETDDVALARTILTVPINPEFGSLNLAQAVILVAYEWSKGLTLAQPPRTDLDPPAPQGELEGMIVQFDAALDAAGFYFPPSKVPTTKRAVRALLTRPGWTHQEVRTMRGMIAALVNPRPKAP